jgi:hypothetical protein
MSIRASLLVSAFVAVLVALPSCMARTANWLEMNFYMSGPEYEGKLPTCDHRGVLIKIASRFNQQENMYWNNDLRMVDLEQIRETAFRL